jgi:hypothetical protein
MMAEDSRRPRKAERLLERELDEEIVVLSPEGNVLHSFEGSARFIWRLIDGNRTIDAILDAVTEEYQVEPATARTDLEIFLEEIQGLSLIRI